MTQAPTSADGWRVTALTMMGEEELHASLRQDVAWVKAAAACGLAAAQVRLGRMFLEGEGTPRDQAAAFENFRKATLQGDIDAHNMLARCHENGWGTVVDPGEAARQYRIAAEGGLDWAQYNLGHMLLSGSGVARNRDEAFFWYSRAAKQGHERAMNLVGRCCEQGWGTRKDAGAALVWYRRSARGGYFRGAFNFASMLAGSGCLIGACFWFRRAVGTAPEPTRSNMVLLLSKHKDKTLQRLAAAYYAPVQT